VVAVISYTGFDMDDAMIINKSAFERGFSHGSVYKTKLFDLDEEEKHVDKNGSKPVLHFLNSKRQAGLWSSKRSKGTPADPDADPEDDKFVPSLDIDGLPLEGEIIDPGEPLCCMVDEISGEHRVIKNKENERAYVDTVRILAGQAGPEGKKDKGLRRVSITIRIRRNPIIGDKFSSRHGQKGTLSVLWPQHDMPFSESGMSPDILINPHAFPSRMTIGMLVESMAGKSGALNGKFHDATPFQFHEENRAIDYMGEQLRTAGYHYYGSEPLYSGVSGTVLHADIFMGVVYYQRLRHMVSDKSQVRATGPVMAVTRQPVKGRKKHGGIRLGEMERDALLSHGVSFCVHDRLMNCSDVHVAHVCSECGSLLNVHAKAAGVNSAIVSMGGGTGGEQAGRASRKQYCNRCNKSGSVRAVYLPYIFRYLANELAGMGIVLNMKLSN
jgi:DNA-directed RNA polymerase I subunit RPA2